MNFNRRSPEEFQWKIFPGEDLQALTVLAGLCHLDGKLHWTKKWICFKFAQRKYDANLCKLGDKSEQRW